ncbi:hypothetical protein [Xanthobacter flavus]|uniref:hypothetical protein n=1 Tax=Xanthobacter flavus TaxID=281 RepID=UPI003726D558
MDIARIPGVRPAGEGEGDAPAPAQEPVAVPAGGMRSALATAIRHIEHMAVWITAQNSGYSFEGLGEDMPGIKAALSPQDPGRADDAPA